MKTFSIAAAILALMPLTQATAEVSLAPFPKPDVGEVRHVIQLPARSDEQRLQIEIQVGKTLTIDCNHYGFSGELTEQYVPGWGYEYFVYSKEHPLVSTEKACSPGSEHPAFVQAVDANRMLRYNSQMPVIIYTPRDMDVRYVLWRTDAEPVSAVKQ